MDILYPTGMFFPENFWPVATLALFSWFHFLKTMLGENWRGLIRMQALAKTVGLFAT